MFEFVAKHKRLLQVVLALTILPFAFFGLESYTRAMRGGDAAATVDGTPISQREFSDETRRQQERLRQVLGANADTAALETPEMRAAILDSLVSQRLLTNEVADRHISMSKDEVVAAILAAPEFQEGGKFSAERYAGYLRTVGLSDEGNVAKLRLEIPASRLANVVLASAFEPRAVVARLSAIEGEKREVAEALVAAAPFAATVKPDEAAIKAYYDSHLADYRVPERIRAEYVVLSAEALAQNEPPATEAEIKAAYDARSSQYAVAEQRRASHILVATREEADKILAEVRAQPQRFAELAKAKSQDTGSAANGGDLGMNPRGGLASKALEDAIFGLKPGEATVAQSEFGFHVVRLAAVQPGKAKPLDEVRKELADEVQKQKGAKKLADSAEAFNNTVYEQSDSLKPAAERFKLKIATTGWFARPGAPDLGPLSHPKIVAALFSPDALEKKRNTDAFEVSPGVLVAARVAEHQAEKQKPFDEVKADVAQRLARREGLALAK